MGRESQAVPSDHNEIPTIETTTSSSVAPNPISAEAEPTDPETKPRIEETIIVDQSVPEVPLKDSDNGDDMPGTDSNAAGDGFVEDTIDKDAKEKESEPSKESKETEQVVNLGQYENLV